MSEWLHRIVLPAVMVSTAAAPAYATTYLTVEQAKKACFPNATEFEPSTIKLTPEQKKAIEKDSDVRVRLDSQKVWRAKEKDKFLGWVIEDEVLGKHEFITWVLALTPEGAVKQIEILDYRETYGSEIRKEDWRAQFRGKRHGAKLKLNDDVKNISGATLSSRHITDGVRRLLSFYEYVLKS